MNFLHRFFFSQYRMSQASLDGVQITRKRFSYIEIGASAYLINFFTAAANVRY